jgi:hypothetical protein
VNHSYEYGAQVIPLGKKTRVTETVGDELRAPKADGFTQDESNASLVVAVGNNGGF